ncbi:MAG: hypothetical protein Q8O67_13260 [Deltaproteobacteria bacterium]|nr:hypothetical protein [Deltaproteobacteria bacterium]
MRGFPRFAALLVVVLFALSGCSGCRKVAPPSAELTPKAQLISDLALFASGQPLSVEEATKLGEELASGKLTVADYIDELTEGQLGARLAKDLVLSAGDGVKDRHPLPQHSVLRMTKDKETGDEVYYLKKKCAAIDAVSVKAWWVRDEAILICPDSYRPEVKSDKQGRTCGASMLAPRDDDVCGCGPRLMFCTKTNDMFNRMKGAIAEEVLTTAKYVVDNDRPLEELFTMNATVRNDVAEALYRRARVLAGEPETLLPVTGWDSRSPQPRVEQIPGQHAGVLSTPALTYSSDALRGVMRNYFDDLWCSGGGSSGVTTDKMMQLKEVPDLRIGEGWKELASMEICTDCHARLDYGMQFFWGYPSSTMGVDFRPKDARTGQGPLYNRDIKDERGVADLTPQGFAKLVVAQPEFGKCMTRKVVDHVFNGSDRSEDFDAVLAVYQKTHRTKAMLRAAMLRYAERNLEGSPSTTTLQVSAGDAPALDGDRVKIPKALRETLDDKCMSCHDDDDAHDFNGSSLPRATMLAMIDRVGFGSMPKNAEGLEDEERKAFVSQVAALVYNAADARKEAAEYFANGLRGWPVHRIRSGMANVNERSVGGNGGFRVSGIEGGVPQSEMTYSPSVAAQAAVSAMKSCRDKGLKAAELEACVERGTAPSAVTVGAVTNGPPKAPLKAPPATSP